jgi:hypothetical protein
MGNITEEVSKLFVVHAINESALISSVYISLVILANS